MEDFDLSVIALLDSYDALPELQTADGAADVVTAPGTGDLAMVGARAALLLCQTQQQQFTHLQRQPKQHQRHSIDTTPTASQLSSSEDGASDASGISVLHATEQLLDGLDMPALLDSAQSLLPPQQQQQPPSHELMLPVASHINSSNSYTSQLLSEQMFRAAAAGYCLGVGNESKRRGTVNSSSRNGSRSSTTKSRNLSRERLKSELTYLRHKVRELEDELRVLRPNSTLTGSGSNAASVVAVDRKKAILPVWQRIAERQLEGRSKVEAENARLKRLLDGQLKLAKSLEQVLRKRPTVTLDPDDAASSPDKKPRLALDDNSVYTLLLDGLEAAYARLDAVFDANGLADTIDESIRHAHVKTRGSSSGSDDSIDSLVVELTDVFVIPFDLQVSANAAWRSVTQQFPPAGGYVTITLPPDTIATKYHATSYRRSRDVRLDVHLVMRRFVERERVVFVWRSMAHGDGRQLGGMYTDETGWCVLKRIPATAVTAGAYAPAIGTVMQSCVHVVPKRAGSDAAVQQDEPEVGMLTNIVIDAYEDDVIAINKTMENLLLEEALSIGATEKRARASAAKAKVAAARKTTL